MAKGNKKGNILNPTGKGGFKDNPQNRNTSGSWSSDTSVPYWTRKLMTMTVDEFLDFPKLYPKESRLMAADLAYNAVLKARKDLGYLKEVTDRTSGKAEQKRIIVDDTNNPFEGMSDDQINSALIEIEKILGK